MEGVNELGFQYKDCLIKCDDSNCNTGLDDVASLFSSDTPQDSCFTCRYHQLNSGEIEGRPDCFDLPTRVNNCPAYANEGCYTSSSIHFVEEKVSNSIDAHF